MTITVKKRIISPIPLKRIKTMSAGVTTGVAIRLILDIYPGITKTKLANTLGVTRGTVYNWEQDRAKMSQTVYLTFRKVFPNIRITDIPASEYQLGKLPLPAKVGYTWEIIKHIFLHDPEANQARLAEALGCTVLSVRNYKKGKSRISTERYTALRGLYPTLEVTDVYGG